MTGVPVTDDRSLRPLPNGGHAVRVARLPAAILLRHREELIAVAAQAFAAAPWHERPADAVGVIDRMWCRLGQRDFVAVAALDGTHVAGFAYGHTDTVCAAMNQQPGSPAEAFELVELAVAPVYQGRGIGRALHDELLAEAPSPRLLLTHPEAPARRRYRRWGWSELAECDSPHTGRPLLLMHHTPSRR